jgi:hypothetical protein
LKSITRSATRRTRSSFKHHHFRENSGKKKSAKRYLEEIEENAEPLEELIEEHHEKCHEEDEELVQTHPAMGEFVGRMSGAAALRKTLANVRENVIY